MAIVSNLVQVELPHDGDVELFLFYYYYYYYYYSFI